MATIDVKHHFPTMCLILLMNKTNWENYEDIKMYKSRDC